MNLRNLGSCDTRKLGKVFSNYQFPFFINEKKKKEDILDCIKDNLFVFHHSLKGKKWKTGKIS